MRMREVPLLAKVAIVGTLTLAGTGVTYYVVEGPTVPQPEPTASAPEPSHEPQPEPTQEPTAPPTQEPQPEPSREPTPSPDPAPSPTATPTPAPSPTASPTPTPSPSPTATPAPSPSPTATPPPNGQIGGGWQAVGGAGCPKGKCGDVYHVTTLADAGPGSLRNGILNRVGPRTIVFDTAGVIELRNPQIKVRLPYLTIDGFSAPATGITLQDAECDADRMLGILSTHDITFRGLRWRQCWAPGDVEYNWETLMMDGEASPVAVDWDDEPPKDGNRDIYLERNTFIDAMNDIGSVWCGADGVTLTNNLVLMSYHPNVAGCKGWRAADDPESRHSVSFLRNVYWKNGERAPKVTEGCYGCDVVNNISGSWQNYSGLDPQGSGPGGGALNIRDSPNWDLNVIGNVFPDGEDHYARVGGQIVLLPGAWRPEWDCWWGADPGSPTGDPRMARQHFSWNLFSPQHVARQCVSTTGGGVQFPRAYPLGILPATALEPLIDLAGMPWPDARELALKAEVRAAYRKRIGR